MKNLLILVALLIGSLSIGFSQGCDEPDGDDGVQVMGYIQPQIDYKLLDEPTSNFYLNRARIGVMGNIPYDFGYYVMLELAPKQNPETRGSSLCDAFITYKRFGPFFKASIGQFKSPFGMEQLAACYKLNTIYRSQVVDQLAGPIRDLGFMVMGSSGDKIKIGSVKKDFITYRLAIMNGTGRNFNDNNTKKDIIGRLTIQPLKYLKIGASYRFGAHPAQAVGVEEDDTRSRMGFDIELKYKGVLLQGEYISGSDVGSYTTGGGCGEPLEVHEGSVNRSGYFVTAGYKYKNVQPIVKYESYEPNKDMDLDIENTLTFGVNYFFNDWVRVQFNYLYKAEETGDVEHKNDEAALQVQVKF